MTTGGPGAEEQDFSLVRGGPLFQLLLRAGLCDHGLRLVPRRIIMAGLITWAPLLALSALQGVLVGADRTIPFLYDVEVHLRFLVAVPLLIVAERVVHDRLRPLVRQFRARGLVRPDEAARFEEAVSGALRLRNSVVAECLLIVVVYAVGILIVWRQYALHTDAWYMSAVPGRGQLSPAGYWLVFVSVPIFQFLLLRWYFRLFVWAVFLWRVSRLNLDLYAIHPDKAGGLGFLGLSVIAFVPIATAHGVMVAGMLANRIFYGGAKLTDFQVEVFAAAVFLLVVFVGPLTVFGPLMARVRRAGIREYGALGQTYVRSFRDKWIGGGAPADEPLLGTSDIQSLADLANSFAVAQAMRFTPITRTPVFLFVVAFLAPIAPLELTAMPVEKILGSLVKIVL